jgi:hypothetical protein
MRNWETVKARYLKLDRSHQLGELASNLARIRTQIRLADEVGEQIAFSAVEECQRFTEWTITMLNPLDNESDLMLAEELLTLGRQLTKWKLYWLDLLQNQDKRREITTIAEHWSFKMIDRSGLLELEQR